MKRIQKTKEWIKEHKDQIATTAFVGGISAFYVAVIVYSIKAYNDQVKNDALVAKQNYETKQEMAKALGRGASIIPGPDGGYWILEREAS